MKFKQLLILSAATLVLSGCGGNNEQPQLDEDFKQNAYNALVNFAKESIDNIFVPSNSSDGSGVKIIYQIDENSSDTITNLFIRSTDSAFDYEKNKGYYSCKGRYFDMTTYEVISQETVDSFINDNYYTKMYQAIKSSLAIREFDNRYSLEIEQYLKELMSNFGDGWIAEYSKNYNFLPYFSFDNKEWTIELEQNRIYEGLEPLPGNKIIHFSNYCDRDREWPLNNFNFEEFSYLGLNKQALEERVDAFENKIKNFKEHGLLEVEYSSDHYGIDLNEHLFGSRNNPVDMDGYEYLSTYGSEQLYKVPYFGDIKNLWEYDMYTYCQNLLENVEFLSIKQNELFVKYTGENIDENTHPNIGSNLYLTKNQIIQVIDYANYANYVYFKIGNDGIGFSEDSSYFNLSNVINVTLESYLNDVKNGIPCFNDFDDDFCFTKNGDYYRSNYFYLHDINEKCELKWHDVSYVIDKGLCNPIKSINDLFNDLLDIDNYDASGTFNKKLSLINQSDESYELYFRSNLNKISLCFSPVDSIETYELYSSTEDPVEKFGSFNEASAIKAYDILNELFEKDITFTNGVTAVGNGYIIDGVEYILDDSQFKKVTKSGTSFADFVVSTENVDLSNNEKLEDNIHFMLLQSYLNNTLKVNNSHIFDTSDTSIKFSLDLEGAPIDSLNITFNSDGTVLFDKPSSGGGWYGTLSSRSDKLSFIDEVPTNKIDKLNAAVKYFDNFTLSLDYDYELSVNQLELILEQTIDENSVWMHKTDQTFIETSMIQTENGRSESSSQKQYLEINNENKEAYVFNDGTYVRAYLPEKFDDQFNPFNSELLNNLFDSSQYTVTPSEENVYVRIQPYEFNVNGTSLQCNVTITFDGDNIVISMTYNAAGDGVSISLSSVYTITNIGTTIVPTRN